MEDSSTVLVSVDVDGGRLQRCGVFVHVSAAVSDVFQPGIAADADRMAVDFWKHSAANVPVFAVERGECCG